MIQWVTSIFAQPAQKAQLFSILLSAFVAFSVLLLNQWFLSRRARKEHLINKIEEFYEAIGEYEEIVFELLHLMSGIKQEEPNVIKETIDKVQTAVQRIEMYTALHFPNIEFDLKNHERLIRTAYYNMSLNRSRDMDLDLGDEYYKKELDESEKAFHEVRRNTFNIKKQARKLMLRYKH